MTRPEITTIFFDIGKVLVGFDHTRIWQGLSPYSAKSPKQVQEAIQGAGLMNRHETGELPPFDFFQEIRALAEFQPSLQYETFRNIWEDIFWASPEMFRLAEALRHRYAVGLLSNVGEIHWEWLLSSFPIFSLFDDRLRVLSFRVGVMKPETRIYQEAISRSQSQPNLCVYIDDLEENVLAGREAGMYGICCYSPKQVMQELRELGVDWEA